jgi:hypothetical protein
MTLAEWTWSPVHPHRRIYVDPSVRVLQAGSPKAQRYNLHSRGHYEWDIEVHARSESVRAAVEAFIVARRGETGAFYYRCRVAYQRVGVALGTSPGGTSTFALPTTGEFAGDYPIADANAKLYANGSPVTMHATPADTDGRLLVAAANVSGGQTMTADYWYFRRVTLFGEQAPIDHVIVGRHDFRVRFIEAST